MTKPYLEKQGEHEERERICQKLLSPINWAVPVSGITQQFLCSRREGRERRLRRWREGEMEGVSRGKWQNERRRKVEEDRCRGEDEREWGQEEEEEKEEEEVKRQTRGIRDENASRKKERQSSASLCSCPPVSLVFWFISIKKTKQKKTAAKCGGMKDRRDRGEERMRWKEMSARAVKERMNGEKRKLKH